MKEGTIRIPRDEERELQMENQEISEQIVRERELITTINLLTKAIEVLTERLAEVSELKKLVEADRGGR